MYGITSKQRVCKDPYSDSPGPWGLHAHTKLDNEAGAVEYCKHVFQEHKSAYEHKVADGVYTHYEIEVYLCDYNNMTISLIESGCWKSEPKKRTMINKEAQQPSPWPSTKHVVDFETLINSLHDSPQSF